MSDMHLELRLPRLVASLKQPKYTGKNRCLPCTVLNSLITVGLAAGVTVGAAAAGSPFARQLGVLTVIGGLVLIYFRGYLIPGTPALTKRYLPAWLRRRITGGHHQPAASHRDPTELLTTLGIIVDDPEADDLTLDPLFLDEWRESVTIHWADELLTRESIGGLSHAAPETIRFEERPTLFRAWADGVHLATWPSRAACVADAAAARELSEWDPHWSQRSLVLQADMLGTLRLFIEQCPACEGTVSLAHDVVESCCWSHDVAAATCEDCNTRLFEMDIDPETLSAQSE